MSTFEYYASLRADILEVITGVEDSGVDLYWDDTTPNYVTKGKLGEIYKKYLAEAEKFGLYVVTRHCDCPNSNHSGYSMSNIYGLEVTYRDEHYVWSGGQMYQGPRSCVCPCSLKNKKSQHHVIDDVIYDKSSDQELCENIEGILYDVIVAMDCAGDNKPRSAIRENLLRAVIRLNDQLLPEPMDIFIENGLNKIHHK